MISGHSPHPPTFVWVGWVLCWVYVFSVSSVSLFVILLVLRVVVHPPPPPSHLEAPHCVPTIPLIYGVSCTHYHCDS